MTSIQYASDLHLDRNKVREKHFHQLLVPRADILVLAGDMIDDVQEPIFKLFLQYCVAHWTHTILILGNHEYHGDHSCNRTMAEIEAEVQAICEELNQGEHGIYFLDSGYVVIEGITFVGCPLWVDIPVDKHDEVARISNDYQRIVTEHGLLTPAYVTNMHHVQLAYLDEIITSHEQVVVITHHPPLWKGTHNLHVTSYEQVIGLVNNLRAFIGDRRQHIKGWIFGHTHHSCVLHVGPVPVVSNAYGRGPPKVTNSGYVATQVLEIE